MPALRLSASLGKICDHIRLSCVRTVMSDFHKILAKVPAKGFYFRSARILFKKHSRRKRATSYFPCVGANMTTAFHVTKTYAKALCFSLLHNIRWEILVNAMHQNINSFLPSCLNNHGFIGLLGIHYISTC